MALNHQRPKALFFDVFGTCVDWRSTVTNALFNGAQEALKAKETSMADNVRRKAAAMSKEDWGALAQEWRTSYLKFTLVLATDPSTPWKSVDQHHLESLHDILTSRELILPQNEPSSLWNEAQLNDLHLIWHRLDPWPDTNQGLQDLNALAFKTATLSNGNLSLLQDMVEHAGMPFTHIYSAEMFQSYKPSPKVYLGAAEKMGLEPAECCLVAAHLDDLKAAKSNGFSTVYIERWMEERNLEGRKEADYVDVWVKEREEGFVEAARRLGNGGGKGSEL